MNLLNPTARAMRRLAAMVLMFGVMVVAVPNGAQGETHLILVSNHRARDVAASKDVVWILGVGSDARAGEDFTRTRGDAIQLVGINTKTDSAAIIGIPRDSYVPIPGYGNDKINAALYYGGPQSMADAVGDLVGIDPDYVVVVKFTYFRHLINSIGGVVVDNPEAFDDPNLKPEGFPQGQVALKNHDALHFARIRYGLLRGDFDRSANQQLIVKAIQRRLANNSQTPGFLDKGVLAALNHSATNLPPAELFVLARAAAQVDPIKVTNCVLQGSIGNIGGASVVLPFTDQAARLGDLARDDATLESCD